MQSLIMYYPTSQITYKYRVCIMLFEANTMSVCQRVVVGIHSLISEMKEKVEYCILFNFMVDYKLINNFNSIFCLLT